MKKGIVFALSWLLLSLITQNIPSVQAFDFGNEASNFNQIGANLIIPGDKVIHVGKGIDNSGALTEGGQVLMWGNNLYGQLGDSTTTHRFVPVNITANFPLAEGDKITTLSIGSFHSLAMSQSGRIFLWGRNFKGELGDGTTTMRSTPIEFFFPFSLDPGDQIKQINAGNSNTMMLTEYGRFYVWGSNNLGQLGNNLTVDQLNPTNITGQFALAPEDKIIQFSIGTVHTSALSQSGRVFTWGYNFMGRLGDGTETDSIVPIEITHQFALEPGDQITFINLGSYHSSALSEFGEVFTWGSNSRGEGGNNTTTHQYSPVNITSNFALSEGDKIVNINLGMQNSSAISQNYQIFGWGFNSNGNVGDGTTTQRTTPVNITSHFQLDPGDTIRQVSMVGNSSIGLSASGKVHTWGGGAWGQLGHNSTTSYLVPTEIVIRSTLTFVANGGSPISPIVQEVRTPVSAPAEPTREGYTFSGWYSDFILSNIFVFDTMPVQNTTIYVKWIMTLYSITYHLDGGTNHPSQVVSYGFSTGTITLNSPTKTGYTFQGWYDSQEYTNVVTQIPTGSSGNVSLYAKWAPNEYVITFYPNGGSDVSSITQQVDTPLSAPSNPFKEHYTFAGWYRNVQLTQLYTFTTMPSQHTSLYAKWTPVTYTIDYQLNGGVNHVNNPLSYHIESQTILLGSASRVGHTFVSWYLSEEMTGGGITQIDLGSSGNITLYARWMVNSYTITFNSNGGSVVSNITQAYQSAITSPVNPTRAGYTFQGWSEAIPSTMPAQNMSLTAQWGVAQYTMSFDTSGGNPIPSLTQDFNTAIVAPSNPTRTGYTFIGWSQAIPSNMPGQHTTITAYWSINSYTITFDSSGGSAVSSITQEYNTGLSAPANPTRVGYTFAGWSQAMPATMPAESITISANWTINSYSITFNSNGGSAISSITQDYGTVLTAPANPTRVGYTFAGWSQVIPVTMPAQSITISANWTINAYSITFHSNGGSAISSITQDYNTVVTSPANPTRVGYTFAGWSQAIPATMPGESITLTANWTINTYSITFNSSGGSVVASITQDYGTGLPTPPNPTRAGYVFNGWSSPVPTTMPAHDLTMEAYWIQSNVDSSQVEVETNDLHEKIDPSIMEGKNAELTIKIEVKSQDNVLPSEVTIVSDVIKNNLELRRSGSIFINIEIILKEAGLDDVFIQELIDPLTITILIPQEHRGYQNYHIIRVHNGIADVLSTQYDKDAQTLTFETDRFSTYVIAYDSGSGGGMWWLLLLLLLPIAYVGYVYAKKKKMVFAPSPIQAQTSTIQEIAISKKAVQLDEVLIPDLEKRPHYQAFEAVENGDYLEVTMSLEASNRVVEVSSGQLPKLMNEENHFIPLQQHEVAQFKEIAIDLVEYHTLTPGSYSEAGYFMEVDQDNRSVDNFVHAKKRLPPTSAKGHRWVRIEPRRIKSE